MTPLLPLRVGQGCSAHPQSTLQIVSPLREGRLMTLRVHLM